ncbi:MAG: autotransporter domain-containing protein [Tistlia sp.]|uniref:autotransporter outer membrane beta-barrel domain-containing protein n=1 Tax=Tistlia sp. TaxID=3057121 RepID=UPI0034A37EAF
MGRGRARRLGGLGGGLLVLALPAGAALAQFTWDGEADRDWNRGANWTGDIAPGPGDDVVVDLGPGPRVGNFEDATVFSLSGGGPIALGTQAFLSVVGNRSTTFSGSLTGAGDFYYDGGGTLTLTGDSDIEGSLSLCSCGGGQVTIDGGFFAADSSTEVSGATLRLENGGRLETGFLYLDGSSFIVDGSGSRATIAEETIVGYVGGATMTVSNGGLVESRDDAFIDALFARPTATVTGSGSRWEVAGTLYVGNGTFGGLGTLTVAEGGLVSAGLLEIGPDSRLNLGDGGLAGRVETAAIENDGEIVADFTDRLTLGADISGSGGLFKDGSGTLILSGTNSYLGTTDVRRGALLVEGVLAGPVVVDPDGTLGGSGRLLGSLGSRGTIAPGSSIGTLTVDGDVTFLPGSVLAIELTPGGTSSDLLYVRGAAEILGGTVRPLALSGSFADSATYRILTAEGGLQGRFQGVEEDFAFLDHALAYDAENVYLTVSRNDTALEDITESHNHGALARALQSLGPGSALHDRIVGFSEEQALQAYEALSGELHANVAGNLVEESRLLREISLARLRQKAAAKGRGQQADGRTAPVQLAQAGADDLQAPPESGTLEAWVQAFGSWGSRDGDGNAAAVDHSMGGLLLGADAPVSETWRLGLFTGYDRREASVDDRRSSATVDTVHLGAYAGTELGPVGLAFGAAWSWHSVESERDVVFPGFSDSLEGDYGATTAQVFAEASYDLLLGEVGLQPFAGLAYVRTDSDGFSESGGEAALSVEESDHGVGYGTLGLRAATGFQLDGLPTLTALGALGWRHAFGNLAPDGSATLGGSDSFTIHGLPVARDAALIEAGLAMPVGAHGLFDLSYAGTVADGYRDHGLNLTLAFRF